MDKHEAFSTFDNALEALAPQVAAEDGFARELYAALCNMQWRLREGGELVSMSWRSAGATVARLTGRGECYLDYYCSGNEGIISKRIGEALGALGWTPVPWPD
jgi:hypothetical protein